MAYIQNQEIMTFKGERTIKHMGFDSDREDHELDALVECLTGGSPVLEILFENINKFTRKMQVCELIMNLDAGEELTVEDDCMAEEFYNGKNNTIFITKEIKEVAEYQYKQYDALISIMCDNINCIESIFSEEEEEEDEEYDDEEIEFIPIRKLLNSAILNEEWVGFEGDSEYTIDDETRLGCWAFLGTRVVNDTTPYDTLDDEIPAPEADMCTNIEVLNNNGVLCEVEFRY